jgi:hypothetical protein
VVTSSELESGSSGGLELLAVLVPGAQVEGINLANRYFSYLSGDAPLPRIAAVVNPGIEGGVILDCR